MRGNHLSLGRSDYVAPPPISATERAAVAACTVSQYQDRKTWNVVELNGKTIGFVTTRMAGQSFRTPEMTDWFYCANDWHESDPPHAKAILALIQHTQASEQRH